MLEFDSAPHSAAELDAADPFRLYMSPQRCELEAYVDSGDARVSKLRRCKLAELCAMLHLEDEPYARCIGKPLVPQAAG